MLTKSNEGMYVHRRIYSNLHNTVLFFTSLNSSTAFPSNRIFFFFTMWLCTLHFLWLVNLVLYTIIKSNEYHAYSEIQCGGHDWWQWKCTRVLWLVIAFLTMSVTLLCLVVACSLSYSGQVGWIWIGYLFLWQLRRIEEGVKSPVSSCWSWTRSTVHQRSDRIGRIH